MGLPARLRGIAPSVRRLAAHGDWSARSIGSAFQISVADVREILQERGPPQPPRKTGEPRPSRQPDPWQGDGTWRYRQDAPNPDRLEPVDQVAATELVELPAVEPEIPPAPAGSWGHWHDDVARGERNARHVLTEADVREIRHWHRLGVPPRVLARRFGVSRNTIGAAVARRTWTHI